MPGPVQRFARIGLIAGAVAGGIGGLIRGLQVHPATAWFAIFELGVPTAIVGGALGLCCGLLIVAIRRLRRHGPI